MVTTRWQGSSAALGKPLSSRPKSSPTGPASPRVRISAAAARGRCRLRFAVRPRAVKPTTCTQSSNASSRRSNRATRASTSCVWCAMPSTRYGSYSRGLTRRRSRKPKFLSARTTCAMLTRSWGSWSTTRMLMSRQNQTRNATPPYRSAFRVPTSAFASSHQLQYPEPLRILPIAAQPYPAVAAAPHELSRPPLAVGEHLVNDKVETDLAPHVCVVPFRPVDSDGDAVARLGTAPGASDRPGRAGAIARPAHPHRPGLPPLGHHEEPADVASLQVAQVQLQAIRVDVLRLVVEPQRRRSAGGRAEAQLRLRH